MTPVCFDSFEHVSAPVYVVAPDAEGAPRFVAMNAASRKLWSLQNVDFMGKSALELFPAASGRTTFEHHLQVLREGVAVSYASPHPQNGTQLRRLRTDLQPVHDASGRVTHVVGTCTYTASREDMAVLRTAQEEATTQVEHFVALAAHDLRTPMRNVQILTDMLRDGFQDRGDGKVDLIDLLDEVAAKSAGMITDVLAYSQMVVAIPETLTFALDDLCHAIGRVIDPQGQHDLIAPRMVLRADKLAVQIILRNLIDNALKHGGKDRITITITLAEAEAGFIRLAVIDDGVGFSNPGKVFLDSGTYRADCGYGLMGLRRLLTARGGRMEVEERAGLPGGAVLVTLPGQIVDPVTAPHHQAESAAQRAPKDTVPHECVAPQRQ